MREAPKGAATQLISVEADAKRAMACQEIFAPFDNVGVLHGDWRKIKTFGGPERLSGDWWEDHYTREYYRVSTERGDLLWVYYDPRPRAWFWHGWWD